MDQPSEARPRASAATVVLYIFIVLTAIALPLILLGLKVPLVDEWDERTIAFLWLACCGSLAIVIIAGIELKRLRGQPFPELLPLVLWVLVSLHFLAITTHHPHKSGDFMDYTRAADQVLAGESPYTQGSEKYPHSTYVYPPLQAQVMAGLYRTIEDSARVLGVNTQTLNPWNAVFYLFQCMQLLLVIATYWLAYHFTRNLGLGKVAAAVVVAALLVFNNPLLDMLKWNQVNLWVADSILLAIVLLRRHPVLSGLPLALGTHIKLFPVILLLPWTMAKRWKTVLGFLIGVSVIVLVQTNWGQDWQLYREFLAYYGSNTPYRTGFYCSSSYNLLYFLLRPIYHLANMDASAYAAVVSTTTKVVSLIILGWFAARFLQRERAYSKLIEQEERNRETIWAFHFRFCGHAMDAVALAVLISPTVFVHYWVMAIPIVPWAIATRGSTKPWHVGVASFLTLCLPTMAVAFFPYHRVVGLIMLVVLTAPKNVILPLQSQKGRLARLLRT